MLYDSKTDNSGASAVRAKPVDWGQPASSHVRWSRVTSSNGSAWEARAHQSYPGITKATGSDGSTVVVSARVSGYEDFDETRIRHMEMIQAVVSRLGNNSFVVKGWAITVAGAFFAFAVSRDEPRVALVGLVPVMAFYAVDVYYLQAERLFRALFDRVRVGDASVQPFFMGATSRDFRRRMSDLGEDVSWHDTSWRPTLLLYYAGLSLASLVIATMLGSS